VIAWLASVDRWLFVFINSTLANPVGDLLWPAVTDFDKILVVRIVLVAAWIWLILRGGTRGRTAALLLIPVLVSADQLASSVLKPLFDRPRPCHMINGVRFVEQIHLLVNCGPGKSFPSSHAVNNAAVATLFSYYYRRLWPWLFGWAFVICLSRVAVGVHYPSDVLGGAAVGVLVALAIVLIWQRIHQTIFPAPSPGSSPAGEGPP
jgi:undecaprenyl-diphosphatase